MLDDGKDTTAQAMAHKVSVFCASGMTPRRSAEIAKTAPNKRWGGV